MKSSSAKKMWTEDLEKKRIKLKGPGRSKIERKNFLYVEESYMTIKNPTNKKLFW